MSIITRQIEELRTYAKDRKGELAEMVNDAADTIELLSAKLSAAGPEPRDDAVSRKAVVSRISDLLMIELEGKRLPTWNEVYRAVGELPIVRPKSETGRWIPCRERLPERSGRYIVAYQQTAVEPEVAEFNSKKETWSVCDNDGLWWEIGKLSITAWMPLPEPYQEGRSTE